MCRGQLESDLMPGFHDTFPNWPWPGTYLNSSTEGPVDGDGEPGSGNLGRTKLFWEQHAPKETDRENESRKR